jgi:hypothetical protein
MKKRIVQRRSFTISEAVRTNIVNGLTPILFGYMVCGAVLFDGERLAVNPVHVHEVARRGGLRGVHGPSLHDVRPRLEIGELHAQ